MGGLTYPRDLAAMAHDPDTDDSLRQALAEQREALRHVRKHMKLRSFTQRMVAERFPTSEATISKWLRGGQQMTVGQLRILAHILGAKPEELLLPPDDAAAAVRARRVAELVARMPQDKLDAWVQVGEALAKGEK